MHPLSRCSAHPQHVHNSWPFAVLRSQWSLVSSLSAYNSSRAALAARFALSYADPSHIARISCFLPTSAVSRPRPDKEGSCPVWLVLPFHPALEQRTFHKVLRDFLRSRIWTEAFASAWGNTPDVQIAWQMHLPRFVNCLQRCAT